MTKFDLIYDMIYDTRSYTIDEWKDETETQLGLSRFQSYETGKSYQMLWEKDTIIKFEEVS